MAPRGKSGLCSRAAVPALLAVSVLLCVLAPPAHAQETELDEGEQIQMGLSTDVIPVASDFSGTTIAVFGAIENADRIAQVLNEYSVVVTIEGPREDVVVRRKERVAGIWMNRQARTYRNVPGFYALASNRSLNAVAPDEVLRKLELGIERIPLNLFSGGGQTFILPAPRFSDSLRRLRIDDGLFSEDPGGVVFLGTSLFRATLAIPAEVPIGVHVVTAHLFHDNELLASRSARFVVRKVGFEEFVHTLAFQHGLWYGLAAVFIALATGWLASVVFGGNRS